MKIDPTNGYKRLDQFAIWNNDYAFAYPALATNDRDEVGIALGWGGKTFYANSAVGILGDFVVWYPALSNASTTRWGDYVTARQASPQTGMFAGFGYSIDTTSGGGVSFDPVLRALRAKLGREPGAGRPDRITPARAHDRAITLTGMPTVAKAYVQRATVNDCRTQPCDAGNTGTSANSWKAMPPTNGSAHGALPVCTVARVPGGGITFRITPQVLSPTPTVTAAAMAHFATTGKGRTTTLGRGRVRTFPKRAAWKSMPAVDALVGMILDQQRARFRERLRQIGRDEALEIGATAQQFERRARILRAEECANGPVRRLVPWRPHPIGSLRISSMI